MNDRRMRRKFANHVHLAHDPGPLAGPPMLQLPGQGSVSGFGGLRFRLVMESVQPTGRTNCPQRYRSLGHRSNRYKSHK